ncbi:MAG TPA: glycoside hydrolase family 130 protein [Sedimentisphaerales bacterium]|nr:glycoside hydrolase family 130 protein [Sedimentisphaerales bacterium]
MAKKFRHDVIHRWEGNPILTIEDIPFPCNTVFNAACAKYDGQYILLLRVEDLTGRSVFALARSADGYHFELEPEPVMTPCMEEGCFKEYERKGIEDPRITEIDGVFYIMYTAVSPYGPLLALAKTTDFKTFERIALISEPENKNGVLFPEKINGKYARLDRPVSGGEGYIWLSYSDDLITWGHSRCIMTTRGDLWDCWRIGASSQPIRTEDGWLIIYHGVKSASSGPIYRLGAAVLAYDDPSRVLCRSAIPILSPREYYERVGDVNNVVFSCGAILEDDGQELKVYYGASDTSICLGTAKVNELMQFCTIGEH